MKWWLEGLNEETKIVNLAQNEVKKRFLFLNKSFWKLLKKPKKNKKIKKDFHVMLNEIKQLPKDSCVSYRRIKR